jgi:hypothetical protein
MSIHLNVKKYKDNEQDYKEYLDKVLSLINEDNEEVDIKFGLTNNYQKNMSSYKKAIEEAIVLGPGTTDKDIETKILMLFLIDNNRIPSDIDNKYGVNVFYNVNDVNIDKDAYLKELRSKILYTNLEEEFKGTNGGGSRRNKATPKSNTKPKAKPKAKPKHEDMTMKDIKELCKVNQIKLSKVVEGERVVYKKKELITKLKRKKLL